MNCYYHPDREPGGACVSCGHLICDECKVTLGGRIYCNPCADSLVAGISLSKKSNWFERHLNWTMVFGLVGAYAGSFVAGMVITVANPYVGEDPLYAVGLIISLAVLVSVWGWALRKRSRSLWWLPLGLFVPFGFIVLLCLENKSQPQEVPQG